MCKIFDGTSFIIDLIQIFCKLKFVEFVYNVLPLMNFTPFFRCVSTNTLKRRRGIVGFCAILYAVFIRRTYPDRDEFSVSMSTLACLGPFVVIDKPLLSSAGFDDSKLSAISWILLFKCRVTWKYVPNNFIH